MVDDAAQQHRTVPPFPSAEAERDFYAAYDAMLARWPVPVEKLDVPSRYGSTRVNVCGPADGPALVLLHGGGTDSTMWFANVAELSARHRVYAVDQIGAAGRSVHDGLPLRTPSDLMTWLDELLSGLKLSDVDLCGHSYGGWIALGYTLHAPERVRRLVLLEPTRCFAGISPRYLLRALPMLLRPNPRRVRGFLTWESGAAGVDEQALELAASAVAFSSSRVVTGPAPAADRIRSLRTPTLLLLAEHSRQHDIARVARNAERLLPDARVVVLPGVSHHSVPMRHPDALNAAVRGFLD